MKEEDLDLGPKEPGRWKEAFQRGKAALKRVGAGGSAEDGENQEGSEESGEAKNRFSLWGLFGRRQGQGTKEALRLRKMRRFLRMKKSSAAMRKTDCRRVSRRALQGFPAYSVRSQTGSFHLQGA